LLILRSDGMELRGEDTLLPQAKPRDDVTAHVRFHLGPDIEIAPTDQPQTALLRMADGSNWAFITSGGILSVDDSLWVDQNGRPHPTQQLVIAADTGKGALHISWQLRHLG
jgi:uncharacterized heparinase superfamily protein